MTRHYTAGLPHPSASWTRRDLLATAATGSAAAALVGLVPRSVRGMATRSSEIIGSPDPLTIIDSTDVRALAQKALDAAKAAGATYADVRLTRVLTQRCGTWAIIGHSLPVYTTERLGIGVRARFNGAWGFAASPYWEPDEVARLARDAVSQAKLNARLVPPDEGWASVPVATGSWKTPVKVDPFLVTVEEKTDLLLGWGSLVARYGGEHGSEARVAFTREERAVATSDGAYFTQTLYSSSGMIGVGRWDGREMVGRSVGVDAPGGWELITGLDFPNKLPSLYASAGVREKSEPARRSEIGRYDVVFDGASMAALLDQTLGVATHLDRALGYEANASGTSFLGPDPLALLGTFQTASPLVTVTANRSDPNGFATVKWDDEGVEPQPFTLVKDGILVDYQTTRDQASLLAPYYQKKGMPIRSHGCAAAQDATFVTMQHTPNLVLGPGITDATFDTLVADTKQGFAIMGAQLRVDFQARTGIGGVGGIFISGNARQIVNGRLGAPVESPAFTFNTQQLWKNVVALGGAKSVVSAGPMTSATGQPEQRTQHSVRAVPAKVVNVDFIDPTRRA